MSATDLEFLEMRAEIERLRDLHRKNLGTMAATVGRLKDYDRSHCELDIAIAETRNALES